MTAIDAIREILEDDPGVLTVKEVWDRVHSNHSGDPWDKKTIQCMLIGLSWNHPSSKHYPSARKQAFLMWLGSNQFRLWRPESDGEIAEDGSDQDLDGGIIESPEDAITQVLDTSLSLERDLESCLVANLTQLKVGLRLFTGAGMRGRQVDTGVVGRIDLLATTNGEDLYVIELKAGRADDKTMGQLLRYMGWAKKSVAGGREVKGIIVANDFSDALKYAVLAVPSVELKKYEVSFEFRDV